MCVWTTVKRIVYHFRAKFGKIWNCKRSYHHWPNSALIETQFESFSLLAWLSFLFRMASTIVSGVALSPRWASKLSTQWSIGKCQTILQISMHGHFTFDFLHRLWPKISKLLHKGPLSPQNRKFTEFFDLKWIRIRGGVSFVGGVWRPLRQGINQGHQATPPFTPVYCWAVFLG